MKGQQISCYQVLHQVSRNKMGEVYLGEHVKTGQKVIIKTIQPLKKERESNRRFMREIRSHSLLRHPNIVRFIEGDIADKPYIVMEYIEGENLADIILHHGALEEKAGLSLLLKVATGLKYIHENKIIHRDIKPSNILISQEGDVKLADFGISKIVDGKRITKSKAFLGTPYYMSPEQVLSSGDIDYRCDLYSLGATLFHILTGEAPYYGKSTIEICHCIIEGIKPEISPQLLKNISSTTQHLIEKSMQTHADDRYQNIDEMIQDIEIAKQKLFHETQQTRRHRPTPSMATTVNMIAHDFLPPDSQNQMLHTLCEQVAQLGEQVSQLENDLQHIKQSLSRLEKIMVD